MDTRTTQTNLEPYLIVIPVYDGVDLMDIAAPREIFGWLESDTSFNRCVRVLYIGDDQKKTFVTNNGVEIAMDAGFQDKDVQHPNLIWVPGGRPEALAIILNDEYSLFTAYVKRTGANADWVCSVCEGAILLANTGLLDGHNITTHWAFVNCFKKFPKVTVVAGHPRYVKSGNRITGGGISSGLDEALYLVELIAGTSSAVAIQQTMQYYPDPPVKSSIPEAAAVKFLD
ncbi:DJ-1/PfpI family protein [Formosa sp. Hel1_31_208]|uniref:DJ-1/PfpI family protein n=1 Tax=Formosa sp. Hel1_31_208 TaxID=1798225 RepID=UPI00087A92F2|nr:DJ-1/PfpI family protein [Formosa sp. Hel1_31_208]SDS31043.1 DJ-1/PfpI family protein [Formosa sp. Hel1_31_208]